MGRSGALQLKLEIWRKEVIKNDYGEYTETWVFHKPIRAYVYRNAGRQVIDNEEVFDLIRIRVMVRNQTDVEEMDRIKYAGHFYQIDFIQPDDTRRWLTLHCTKINE